jgi:hypothetical protein
VASNDARISAKDGALMIDSLGLIAGVLLVVTLMVVATKGWMGSRQLPDPAFGPSEGEVTEPCPKEFVSRVFSRGDWEFVQGLKSHGIERLFEHERKKVALVWVRQTSALVRKAVREHAYAARQSKNLEFLREVNILSQFLILILSCRVLSIAIHIAGPVRLSGLAQFAQRLSQQVDTLQGALQAGVLASANGTRAM